jgi:isopenicillin-N N-acyltransferase like protein
MKRTRTLFRWFGYSSEWFFLLIFVFSFWFSVVIVPDIPPIEKKEIFSQTVKFESDSVRRFDQSWAKLTETGDWVVYLEGSPFSRGYAYGQLLKPSVQLQEDLFLGQIEQLVPSEHYRKFLMVLIAFINRNLDEHIPVEFQSEIYGVSHAFSDAYDHLAPKYARALNYHAAHDIGHALNDYAMVGCTSFSAKGEYTEDGSLISGRNFDFYMGDEFAREKVLTIMKPEKGHGYVSYSWAGLMGVVSGMNEKGISVTINAAKSKLPTVSKTPISIVVRAILQYASNLDEAIEIAKAHDVFVSETIMVSSGSEKRTILIEKAPHDMAVHETQESLIICSNHYQSEKFRNEDFNLSNIRESDSPYRYERMKELIERERPLNPLRTAEILRNKYGKNDEFLGYGNPKALNQLIAHHGIIFEPEKGLMWISTSPFQMGKFVCYDLSKIFGKKHLQPEDQITIDSLTIAADPFLNTDIFRELEFWRTIRKKLTEDFVMGISFTLTPEVESRFIAANPESYLTYMLLGQHAMSHENFDQALIWFKLALTKPQASEKERLSIENLKNEANRKRNRK